ncbi:MAG: hypothetical protein KAJ75_00025 [Alphaproteobacteria bacterium]|nr:hypothetical protein [Alphaproteobacteria bacterium]
MTNRITSEDVKKAMETFYKGKINIFEAGAEELTPKRIQDRPFFKTVPEGHSSYLQKAANELAGNYELTVDKPAEGSKIETESSQFIEEMETRFRNVKSNATLIFIDPDVIRNRYAMDESKNKSLSEILAHYLQEKFEKSKSRFPLSQGDYELLKNASVDGNSPLSVSQNAGLRQISVVIGSQPDMPMHDMFTRPFGTTERMEKEGLDGESVRKMILYHEIGHALDLSKRGIPGITPNVNLTHERYRAECVADAHAVLQLARDEGHTKTGELLADLRIDTVLNGVSQFGLRPQPKFQKRMGLANSFMMQEDLIQEDSLVASQANSDRPLSLPNSKRGNATDNQPTPGSALKEIEKTAVEYQKVKIIGEIASYNTSATVDATVAFAKKGLADGSLKKMTDKEVHDIADKIVLETSWSQEQIDNFCYSVLTRQKKELELESVFKRAEEAFERQPMLRAKNSASKSGDRLSNEQTEVVIEWRNEVYEKIEKEGGSREDILKVASVEKNKLRKEYDSLRKSDPVIELKMAIINQEFLGNSEHTSELAKVSATVKSSLQNIEPSKSDATGEKLIVEFIGHEMKIFEAAAKGLDKAANRNGTASMEEIEKSRSLERRDYKNVFVAERNSEVIAFRVRKDPEAWKLAQKSPELAKNIEEKAKQKHPQWIDEYHLNFSNNDRFRVERLQEIVEGTKIDLAHVANRTEDIRIAVERNDSKLATKIRKNAPAQKQQRRIPAPKKQEEIQKPGDIIWNKSVRNMKAKTR